MYARMAMFEEIDLSLGQEWAEWSGTEGLRLARELPGYQGVMTLLDRDGRRVVRLHLLDSEENAREAEEILSGPLPASMPEVLKQSIPERGVTGVFEVVERDGV